MSNGAIFATGLDNDIGVALTENLSSFLNFKYLEGIYCCILEASCSSHYITLDNNELGMKDF